MIYEIYSKSGLPIAVKYDGSLEQLVDLLAQVKFIYGRDLLGKSAVIYVDFGNNISHIQESSDEWDNYIKIPDSRENP